MNANTMLNPDTVVDVDAQIARLIQANEELKAELAKSRALAENLEEDRDKLERQRDAIKGSNDLMRTRLAMLHVGIIDTLDRLSNRVQGLPTRDELDDREVRIIRMCKQELSEAERGGAGAREGGRETQERSAHSASAPASSSATHTEK